MSNAALPSDQEAVILKKELLRLFGHIKRIRSEIASIRKHGEDENHFHTMSDLLDATVEETESASNTIMTTTEGIEDILAKVRARTKDKETLALLDQLPDKTAMLFEACAFQDLTGQRIGKVVKSIRFIEERVNALVAMWGKDELEAAATELKKELVKKPSDADLLNGPQRKGVALAQDEVDKLFSQSDIDKLFG